MNPRPAMSALDQKRTFCDPLNPPAKMDIGRHAFGTAFLLLPVTRCMMLHGIRSSSRGNWNDLSKETLYGLGPHKFGVAGVQNGSTGSVSALGGGAPRAGARGK